LDDDRAGWRGIERVLFNRSVGFDQAVAEYSHVSDKDPGELDSDELVATFGSSW
jgi:hypothetical protein